MEIEEAFTTEAIDATGTDVSGDQEDELRRTIGRIYASANVEPDANHLNIGVLCFVAGRTYQTQYDEIAVSMSQDLIKEFLEFLVQKGVS